MNADGLAHRSRSLRSLGPEGFNSARRRCDTDSLARSLIALIARPACGPTGAPPHPTPQEFDKVVDGQVDPERATPGNDVRCALDP